MHVSRSHGSRLLWLTLTLALSLLPSVPGRRVVAQEPTPLAAPPSEGSGSDASRAIDEPSALALAVGGGGSLGAYEAGYLYYLTETLKRNPRLPRIRLATGTSAGSLNALLTLVATCLPPIDTPESSLAYAAWANTRLDALRDVRTTPAMAMLSRGPMQTFMALLEERWNEGLPETCDVVLGVPVTRRRAYRISMDGRRASIPRTEERFVVRIRGRGAGLPPSIENYQDLEHGFALALLPVDGDEADEFGALRDLLFASGAFPFVFSPISLAHCMANVGDDPRGACTPESAVRAEFVDGGLFENRPLRLAATVARTSLEQTATAPVRHRFRETPDNRLRELPGRTYFVELDPHVRAYPNEAPAPADDGDVVAAAVDFAGEVFAGFRSKEIQTLLETYPEVRDSVRSTQTYYPPVSSLLSDFFGFADRKLADFDFILGMHDARKQLEDEFFPAFTVGDSPTAFVVEYPELDRDSGVVARFACMRAYFDDVGDPARLCAGDALRSFRAMLVVTMERLYSNCDEYRAVAVDTPDSHCRAALDGDAPPNLLGTRRRERWRLPGDDQSDVSRASIERLAAYRFHFEDLGLAPDESDRVLTRLRERLGSIAENFVGDQAFNHQMLDAALRALLNSIHYAPPRVVGHLVLGTRSELGVSVTNPYGRAPWLRAAFALELSGFEATFDLERYALRIGPIAGLEIEPTPVSSSFFQLRIGARVGYSFSSFDRLGATSCGPSDFEQASCSRMLVSSYVAVSLADVVRLQLGATLLPGLGAEQRFGWTLGPSLGAQLRSRR